jgi:hypothetical protein
VGGSDFAALMRTSCRRNIKMRQQLEELAKSKTKSRTPLTSRPVGSISRSHRDPSLRADLGSMALRARVAAYSRRRGSAATATSPTRRGLPPRSSRRCGAASPLRGRSTRGGGGRGRPPQSAHGLPDSSARSGAIPTAPDAGAETPHGARRGASSEAPDRCRGGDRARRCEGKTTPAPSLRCWSSSCRGCSRPCADPARRATCRWRAPRGGSSTPTSAA